jgi:hypothetical protein
MSIAAPNWRYNIVLSMMAITLFLTILPASFRPSDWTAMLFQP